mmetsp:Transcript_15163/g.20281  ORF Transcript_15163/g.20281 Transcript_15163/m.20281 type:complete len:589 (-) Transcript_15163:223-1989(-)
MADIEKDMGVSSAEEAMINELPSTKKKEQNAASGEEDLDLKKADTYDTASLSGESVGDEDKDVHDIDIEKDEIMDKTKITNQKPHRSIIVAGVESFWYLCSKGKIKININSTVAVIKCLISLGLLVFSITIIMAAIFSRQTEMAKNIHPIFAFIFFWFLIIWLAMMEGGQGCLVGLQPLDKSVYVKSHPVTFKNTTLAHKDDNMDRFIVGRQFLVVLVIFLINMCGASIKDAEVLNLPTILTEVFLASGVAMMLTTIIVGQLTAQVNAAVCMLDFINSYFMLFTCYVSLFIEFSGMLHSVYLVQIIFARITGKTTGSSKPPRSRIQDFFFWARVLVSFAILVFALAVTLQALFDGNTNMWSGVPSAVSVVIFFLLLSFVGLMDGMQIAAFALVNLPEEELQIYPRTSANCKLIFSDQNLQAFLIGRQICVACFMFVVARISTLNADYYNNNDNIVGVSDGLQNFFNTGLLGAVVLTVIGSLIWRIVASSFPIAFMSNPLIHFIIHTCLLLEKSGICSSAWLLAFCHKHIMKYQIDEVYIGFVEKGAVAEIGAGVNEKGQDEITEIDVSGKSWGSVDSSQVDDETVVPV